LHKPLVRIYGGAREKYVEGRRAIRNGTDRENRKHAWEIVASEVRCLDAAPKREARNSDEFITESSAELQ
jgi:hypothetical protein